MEKRTTALFCLNVILYNVIYAVQGKDPCDTTNYLNDWRRSMLFHIADESICDIILEAGWYRITSGQGEEMPTECVPAFRCNTASPIWLSNDSIGIDEEIFPKKGKVVNRTAYAVHYIDGCMKTPYNIQIKSCNGFLVYYLVPVNTCSSAYCFGATLPCPAGTSSETGFGDCGEYPEITVSPFIEVTLEEEEKIDNKTKQPIVFSKVKFECHAYDLQENYLYDVRWYINDLEVMAARTVNLTKEDIENGYGKMVEDDWTSKFRPSFIVNCSMKVKGNGFGHPSPEHRSNLFFAGIKIMQDENYAVNEKDNISIPVFLTIPLGCSWPKSAGEIQKNHIKDHSCLINLLTGIPNYQQNPSQCDSEIKDSGLIFDNQQCGIAFKYKTWNETKYLHITGAVDNKININDRIVFLRLYNPFGSNNANESLFMWNGITLPDIKVTIRDTDNKTDAKGCWALNDPHMYTFDKHSSWELQQDIGGGEYIMYLHKRLTQQINAYFRKCNKAALCNCGLAVRSGESLFVANFCETEIVENNGFRKRRLNRYVVQRSCDDQSLVVTENGNNIEVILPSGTKVQFAHGQVYDFYGLHGIHIFPSALDIDMTKGLCGTYNGNPDDDFIEHKKYLPTISTTDFAKSWRVDGNDLLEDYTLFHPEGELREAEYYAQAYCTCKVNDTSFPYEQPSYNCDLNSPMEICLQQRTPTSVYAASCATTFFRSKRSVSNHITKRSVAEDLEEDEQPPAYAMVSESKQYNATIEWKNGWTEESARAFCTQNMQNSPAFLPCSEFVPSSNPDSIIESCILDIKLQGDSGWIEATLQNFAASCLTQARRMENLTVTNSTTLNGQEKSIFSIIAESTCPGNCSEHGICVNGKCNCTTGYFGPACDQDKSNLPLLVPDAFEGTCDPTKRPCKKFIIPGTRFIKETLTCRFSQFSIEQNGTTTIFVTGEIFTYPGTYSSAFLMYCELPPFRKRRSLYKNADLNGYNISVSNNGIDFTEELTTIIYNKLCYDCNITSSISCVELETCPTKTEDPPEESKLSTLIIILIALTSVVLVISVGLFCFRKKVRCGKQEPYVSDSAASLPNSSRHAQSKQPTTHNDIFLATQARSNSEYQNVIT